MSLESTLLNFSADKLEQLCGRIESCVDKLQTEQIWSRNSDNVNAIGNLMLHLSGNVRQWILHGVGGQPDVRQRDTEFAARGGMQPAELKQRLRTAVEEAAVVLRGLPHGRLEERVTIQKYNVTVLEAILHVVEHFAGHSGQIIFLTKFHTGEDLGFYSHLKAAGAHGQKNP
jgi:uncharacterized damage-inducible protein DinB